MRQRSLLRVLGVEGALAAGSPASLATLCVPGSVSGATGSSCGARFSSGCFAAARDTSSSCCCTACAIAVRCHGGMLPDGRELLPGFWLIRSRARRGVSK